MNKLLLTTLGISVLAQSCTSEKGQLALQFDACIKTALVNADGLVGPTDALQSCISLKGTDSLYFACLCTRYTNVVQCYTNNCPRDTSLASFQSSQDNFCAQAQQETNPNVATNFAGTLAPLPSGSRNLAAGAKTTVAATPKPTAEFSNQALNPFVTSALIFGEVFALAIFTNLL